MFDIDKELKELKNERLSLSEDLREDTRRKVREELRGSRVRKSIAIKPMLKVFTAAALAVMLFIALSINFAIPARAAAYYTIDINPSVSIAVDENNNVLYVTPENSDAKTLLSGLDLTGKQFEDALRIIIQAAVKDSYLKDNGSVYVAHFGNGEGITQDQVSSIVGEETSDNVNVLVLNSGKDNFDKAEKAGEKAGIELLLNNAKVDGIDDMDVSAVIKIMSEKEKDKSNAKSDNDNRGNLNNTNGDNSLNNSNKNNTSDNNNGSKGNGKTDSVNGNNSDKGSTSPTKNKDNDKKDKGKGKN